MSWSNLWWRKETETHFVIITAIARQEILQCRVITKQSITDPTNAEEMLPLLHNYVKIFVILFYCSILLYFAAKNEYILRNCLKTTCNILHHEGNFIDPFVYVWLVIVMKMDKVFIQTLQRIFQWQSQCVNISRAGEIYCDYQSLNLISPSVAVFLGELRQEPRVCGPVPAGGGWEEGRLS